MASDAERRSAKGVGSGSRGVGPRYGWHDRWLSLVGRERVDDQTDPNGVVLGVQGELYGFYVHPDYWGSGVANALLDASHKWLDARFSTACLWVLRDNPRARRFYERQGWTAHDIADVQYWEGPTIAGLAPLPEPLAELRYIR